MTGWIEARALVSVVACATLMSCARGAESDDLNSLSGAGGASQASTSDTDGGATSGSETGAMLYTGGTSASTSDAQATGGTTDDPGDSSGATSGAAVTTGALEPDPGTSGGSGELVETTGVDPCQQASECTPGEVALGDGCADCGVMTRVCDDNCQWGPELCEDDPGACAIWRLPKGAQAWEAFTRQGLGDDAHAPTSPVRAAFVIESRAEIYAVTDTKFHVLRAADMVWVDSGPRGARFPSIGNSPIYFAYSVAQDPEWVSFARGDDVLVYGFDEVANEFLYDQAFECCEDNDDWQTPYAPSSMSAVRGFWMDLEDASGWTPPGFGCSPQTPSLANSIAVSDGYVHLQDVGYCFDFLSKSQFTQFSPFALAGAPDNNAIGGISWFDGLFVFK